MGMEIRIEACEAGPKVVLTCGGWRVETEDLDKVTLVAGDGTERTMREIMDSHGTLEGLRTFLREAGFALDTVAAVR